jgi:hypothetical protein
VVFFQRVRSFYIFSLGFLLLLLFASGIFAYLVSPLRDPTFQPDSANAGSLVPWLQGVTEEHWLLGANILAFLLSTNLTLILWQRWVSNNNDWLLRFINMVFAWVILFSVFWIMFMIYLLQQWLVD